jgi:hypothetical protein
MCSKDCATLAAHSPIPSALDFGRDATFCCDSGWGCDGVVTAGFGGVHSLIFTLRATSAMALNLWFSCFFSVGFVVSFTAFMSFSAAASACLSASSLVAAVLTCDSWFCLKSK